MTYKLTILSLATLGLASCASGNMNGPPPDVPASWMTPEQQITALVQNQPSIPKGSYRTAEATSLWSSSPKSLFGDRRASGQGDILTILIEIDDEAEMKNSLAQSQNTNQDLSIGAFFGIPEIVNRNLPNGASLSPAVNLNRGSNLDGNGNIKREEKITLRLAARVTRVLPNGYLQLTGRQEIKVNYETRYLQVTGLARTQDISRLNTITYDKIAEAQIYYGGQGQLTDSIRSRSGNRALTKIIPF